MTSYFPVVGFVGSGPISRMMIAPANDLGVDLLTLDPTIDVEKIKDFARMCNVISHEEGLLPISTIRTLEEEGFLLRPSSSALEYANRHNALVKKESSEVSQRMSVMIARSPHNQCSVWAPTQLEGGALFSITPPPGLSHGDSVKAQKLALDTAHEMGLVGVMSVEISHDGEEMIVTQIKAHPNLEGNWTLEGSLTSQLEQHLRAILDLPLGDPRMTGDFVVSATFYSGTSPNMYRPYLHLMARTPNLKFHQYRGELDGLGPKGHVTAIGNDLVDLRQCVTHAIDYMSGAVDE